MFIYSQVLLTCNICTPIKYIGTVNQSIYYKRINLTDNINIINILVFIYSKISYSVTFLSVVKFTLLSLIKCIYYILNFVTLKGIITYSLQF